MAFYDLKRDAIEAAQVAMAEESGSENSAAPPKSKMHKVTYAAFKKITSCHVDQDGRRRLGLRRRGHV